jgi:hypothetical protein
MPKPYSLDLGESVVRFVEAGRSRQAAASHFGVSVSFVVLLMRHYQATKPGAQAEWWPPSLKARPAPSVPDGSRGREGRHHHAGTGRRTGRFCRRGAVPA